MTTTSGRSRGGLDNGSGGIPAQPARTASGAVMSAPLLAMAISAFVMGTAEFVITGLLPRVAGDLEVSLPTAGTLISGYALAIVVGGPVCTLAGNRLPRKALLLTAIGLFVIGNLVSALAPGYWTLLAGRVLAALGQATFLGVGSVVAANLVPARLRSRAIALVFTGLTLATVLGTPLGTVLGQQLGWRAVFWLITAIALGSLCAVAALVPSQPRSARVNARAELATFTRPGVWAILGTAMLGIGGLFASFSYIAPLLDNVSGLPHAALSPLLGLFGIGLVVGNLLGGWAADRSPVATIVVALAAQVVAMATLAGFAHHPVIATVALMATGAAAFAIVPAFLSRLINQAGGESALAAAAGGSATNLGTAIGSYFGGLVLTTGLGYTAPTWLGATMAAIGLSFILVTLTHRPPANCRAAADTDARDDDGVPEPATTG